MASPGIHAGRGLKHFLDGEHCVEEAASPGIHAGRGLKHVRSCFCRAQYGIARHSCRARIETTKEYVIDVPVTASPGIHAGRGLKQEDIIPQENGTFASPGIHAGRGLKQFVRDWDGLSELASPGIHAGRGLKQFLASFLSLVAFCIARHSCRARIETCPGRYRQIPRFASPGIHAGRGLKPITIGVTKLTTRIARHSCRARIETLQPGRPRKQHQHASPGIHAGRGLKHWYEWPEINDAMHRPAFMPGAD